MQRTSLSLLPRNFLSLKTFNFHLNPSPILNNSSFIYPPASNFFPLNKFSIKTNSNTNSVTQTNQEKESYTQERADYDDVSNEELKKRIAKFYEGDADAIPSIFEAILRRKLAGKHDESDNELLEEFGSKSPDNDSDSE